MPHRPSQLSERAAAILEKIAAGCSHEQIMSALPHITYLDIFDAAREALDLSVAPQFVQPAPPPVNLPWTGREFLN